MMRYDRSTVTLAMKSEVHGASVAQVPANATRTRPRPSSTAQSRRPHAAPSKSIKAAHLPPMPPKKAAAGSASTVPSGQPQHRQHSSNTCQLPRGARQKLCICMPGRGSMSTRWLGVRTWDLDLPPLNRPSRRRCCPASRRFRSATPRTRPPHRPNFCERLFEGQSRAQ